MRGTIESRKWPIVFFNLVTDINNAINPSQQVLEPSCVLSVMHSFDCHSGEVASVSKNFIVKIATNEMLFNQ